MSHQCPSHIIPYIGMPRSSSAGTRSAAKSHFSPSPTCSITSGEMMYMPVLTVPESARCHAGFSEKPIILPPSDIITVPYSRGSGAYESSTVTAPPLRR